MSINNYILSTVGEERPDPINYFGRLWGGIRISRAFLGEACGQLCQTLWESRDT